MICIPPFMRPEPPRPATARPTMSMVELVATPHRREPNSKSPKKEMNVHFVLKRV
jgi:hypothetical protein